MAPAWLSGLGPIANSLGFAGLALLAILGQAFVIRTLWKSMQDEQAKGSRRDSLILDMEAEHQRLLVRFEESMEKVREMDAQRRVAEEHAQQLAAALDRPPPATRRRRV